jgi:hypothetical protein
MLSAVGDVAPAYAYDQRVNPDATLRTEISIDLTKSPERALAEGVKTELRPGQARLPREYASAMTWYRVAMANGYRQAPMVASPWGYDDQLPEPLNWTWIADNGDLVTRVGKGAFRLSLADNQNNWFRDVDCKLAGWPGGDTEAPMTCGDGAQRMLRVPGGGTITVDDVPFTRVFSSEQTNLPPEVSSEELLKQLEASGTVASAPQTGSIPGTAAPQDVPPRASAAGSSQVAASGASKPPADGSAPATAASPEPDDGQIQGVPANVPLPKPRPANPFY